MAEEKAKGVIVGIDLGTTNSAVAWFQSEPQVLPNAHAEELTPSAVARDPRGNGLLVGRAAKDIIAVRPEAGAAFFKRTMGQDDAKHQVGEEHMTPIELSACVLGALRADAERALGQPVRRCVISVPAYFDEGVMELFEGSLEVRSTAGLSHLGGEDFTANLRGRALRELKLVGEHVEMVDAEAWALLYKRCELAKRSLTQADAVEIVIPAIKTMLEEPTPVKLTRQDVEECWRPLLERIVTPVRSALRGARLAPQQIEKVILVGGATRMPCVREILEDLLGQDPLSKIDPDLAIVRGAAIQAALYADDAAVSDIVVTDVASHSLGVDYTREMAGTHVNGYFAPIIHRNTVLPTSRSQTFVTVHANQRTMVFDVYEGESRRVSENRKVGTLQVKGIPKGPAGQSVGVTFTFDLDGILEVEAKVESTGKVFTALFERTCRELTPQERAAAQERIDEIRSDPTERAEISELLARADLLCRDLVGVEREVLAHAIANLEEAILTRTPQLIEQTLAALRELCDQLGEERW
jgi:molecular chaperone HscC